MYRSNNNSNRHGDKGSSCGNYVCGSGDDEVVAIIMCSRDEGDGSGGNNDVMMAVWRW